MAATALTLQTAAEAGGTVTFSTPTQTTGHTAPTGAGVGLIINNTSGGVTVTVYTPGTVHGLAIADRSWVVTASTIAMIPLPPSVYADPTTGLVTFDLSATANTTMACISLGSVS